MVTMHIGVFSSLEKAQEMGFRHVQLRAPRDDEFYKDTPQRAKMIDEAKKTKLEITSMFARFPGSGRYWVAQLPNPRFREERTARMLEIADLARAMGIKAIMSHIGHIPSDREHPFYKAAVKAVRRIADHCAMNGQQFRLETGEESAAVLRQFILDVDRNNVKVHFDPANLMMRGYEGPVEALDLLGEFVAEVHLKDAKVSAPGVKAGECPLGEGDVDFEGMLRKMKDIGFEGVLTIEREITGEEWTREVLAGKAFIEDIKQRLEIE